MSHAPSKEDTMNHDITPTDPQDITPTPEREAVEVQATSQTEAVRHWRVPSLDLARREDGTLRVSVDLPGVPVDAVELELEDGVLSVTGRRVDHAVGYRRRLKVPDTVDPDAIAARWAHGVLTVTLPPRPSEVARSIPVHID